MNRPPAIHQQPETQSTSTTAALAVLGVLLDVQEVGAIVREDRRDVRGHVCVPVRVLIGRDRLEAARCDFSGCCLERPPTSADLPTA
jgi:hypothetical protein